MRRATGRFVCFGSRGRDPLRPTAVVLGLASLAAAVGGVSTAAQEPHQAHSAACSAGPAASRWSTTGSEYALAATFSGTEEFPLGFVGGVTVGSAGTVYVYDPSTPRVHVLSGRLEPTGGFGREGEGPGELRIGIVGSSYLESRRLMADGANLYLHDGVSLKRYSLEGRYLDQSMRGPGVGISQPLIGMAPAPDGLLYGFDSAGSARTRKGRRLQTWRVRSGNRTLVHELPLAAIPRDRNRVSIGPQQARPLWAAQGSCVVVGDGTSPWLLRIDLESSAVDTLRLPPHEVPPWSARNEATSQSPEMRGTMGRMGIPMSDPLPPSALWRWAELVMDPDGHIWVNPWQPRDKRVAPMRVLRIDPRGVVHQETLPAFPLAFGSAGVFYARVLDPDTDEVTVVRYDLRR